MIAESSIAEKIRLAQNGSDNECESIIKENSALIWSIARRFFGRGAEPDDLYQLGCIGMVKAIYGFDENFGTAFSTYAVPKIAGEIRRFLRDDGIIKVSRAIKTTAYKISTAREKLCISLGREPCLSELAEETGLSVEEIAVNNASQTNIEYFSDEFGENGVLEDSIGDDGMEEDILDKIFISDAIDKLEDNEKQVIKLRFFRTLTQQQTAKVLKISQVQVSRVERRALEKLRRFLT